MRRDSFTAFRLLFVPTLAVAVAVAMLPGRAGLVLRLYALYLCCVVVGFAVRSLRAAYPPARPLRPRPAWARSARPRPARLAQLENEAALGVAGAFDLHHRLRPRLRNLAAGLLEARRHTYLDREPEAARRALGDTTWSVVRPDRPAPEDRLARGVPISDLRSVVESLERL
jgi:hypothetical protein